MQLIVGTWGQVCPYTARIAGPIILGILYNILTKPIEVP